MINGDVNDFIDTVYSGQDIPFKYCGKKYWYQGYCVDEGFYMEIVECFPPYGYLWQYKDSNPKICIEAFQTEKIFGGKSFWEVEEQIEWIDE